MNTNVLSTMCFLAIVLVAFFVVRSNAKGVFITVLVFAAALVAYSYGSKHFNYVGSQVVHVDRFTVKGNDLYFEGNRVDVEKNVPPMLFLRCKEEILLRVNGTQYSLFINDNI